MPQCRARSKGKQRIGAVFFGKWSIETQCIYIRSHYQPVKRCGRQNPNVEERGPSRPCAFVRETPRHTRFHSNNSKFESISGMSRRNDRMVQKYHRGLGPKDKGRCPHRIWVSHGHHSASGEVYYTNPCLHTAKATSPPPRSDPVSPHQRSLRLVLHRRRAYVLPIGSNPPSPLMASTSIRPTLLDGGATEDENVKKPGTSLLTG